MVKYICAILFVGIFVSDAVSQNSQYGRGFNPIQGTSANSVVPKKGTFAANDATPDVSGASIWFTTANGGATAITDLDNPIVGKIYILCGGNPATNASTIADSGNFLLDNDFGAMTLTAGACITLYVNADNSYIEMDRATVSVSTRRYLTYLSVTYDASIGGNLTVTGGAFGWGWNGGYRTLPCADGGVGGTPTTCTFVGTCPGGSTVAACSGIDFVCADADGCIITVSETGAFGGQIINIGNAGTNPIIIQKSTGVTEMPTTAILYQWDEIFFRYMGTGTAPVTADRWQEIQRSVNSGPLAVTIPDSGGAGAAAYTLNAFKDNIEITCSDADGCDITLAETYITSGRRAMITNVSANACNFADTAGITELTGAVALGQYDTLELKYVVDRWIEITTSNN